MHATLGLPHAGRIGVIVGFIPVACLVTTQPAQVGAVSRPVDRLDPPPVAARDDFTAPEQFGVEVHAVADAATQCSGPNAIYGGQDTLERSYNDFGGAAVAPFTLVRFDVSILPDYVILDSASMALYVTNATGQDPVNITAYFVDASWDEYGVTWNTRPPVSGPAGVTAGVNGSAGYKSGGVLSWVNYWRSHANYGLELRGPIGPSGSGVPFYDRDFAGKEGNYSMRPRLVIVHHLPG